MQSGKAILPEALPKDDLLYTKAIPKRRKLTKAFNTPKPSMLITPKRSPKHSMRRVNHELVGSPQTKQSAKTKKSYMKQSRSDERLQHFTSLSPKGNKKLEIPEPASVDLFKSIEKPLSPRQTLRSFGTFLTKQEKSEIKKYNEIWSIGIHAHKMQQYSDKEGYYLAKNNDHVAYRFEIKEKLGEGSFGTVFKVLDWKLKKDYALKILRKSDDMLNIGKHEVSMLKYIKRSDLTDDSSIICLEDYFMFRGHLCLLFDLLDLNLYEYLRSQRTLSISEIRSVATSLLKSLGFLKKHGIIHGDVKPENVMIKEDLVKLIDLGSSCFKQENLSLYIQSRHYRAPEVALRITCDCAIDMWSFGCLLGELHTGFPIFTANSTSDLVDRFISILGMPSQDFINKVDKKIAARHFSCLKRMLDQPNVGLARTLEGIDPSLLDLIDQCLKWDLQERITPVQALNHPFIRFNADC